MGVELDFSGIYGLAGRSGGTGTKESSEAKNEPQEEAVEATVEAPTSETSGTAMAKLSKEKEDRKRVADLASHYQKNASKAEATKKKLWDGLKAGKPAEDLLLTAVKCISELTDDKPFLNQFELSYMAIHADGLGEQEAIMHQIKEVDKRLKRLTASSKKEDLTQEAKAQIESAIEAHTKEKQRLLEWAMDNYEITTD